MRFLVLMIPEVYQPKNGKKTDRHFTPDAEMMAKMGKFNEELEKAGALPFAGRAAAAADRRTLGVFRREGQRDGRPVCRNQGSGRWLLDAASRVEAAGRRLDEALPGAGRRRDRDSAGL